VTFYSVFVIMICFIGPQTPLVLKKKLKLCTWYCIWNEICSASGVVCFNWSSLLWKTLDNYIILELSNYYARHLWICGVLGPWLAEVNKLSIQPWDKISNFILISLFCFGIMPYGGVSCQYLSLFVFVSGMKHPRFQVYHFCPCWRLRR
jgi:hypothetical protein